MTQPRRRRALPRDLSPLAGRRVVNSSVIEQVLVVEIHSAPNDHAGSRPDGGVVLPCSKRGSADECPGIRDGVVLAARTEGEASKLSSTPYDHAIPGPDAGMVSSRR